VLYKYLIPDRIDVLERRRIRFTQPVALNDPFELQPYFETVFEERVLSDYLSAGPIDLTPHLIAGYEALEPQQKALIPLDQWLSWMKAILDTEEGQREMRDTLQYALAAIVEVGRQSTPGIRDKWRETFGKQIGILSLSEVADSRLMWSHYAAQHTGFVIGFDEMHPYFDRRRSSEDEFYHLRRVIYREPAAYRSLMELDGEKIFLVKAPDWSYEREWRLLAPLKDATQTIDAPDPIGLFEFPADAVKAVIIGSRTNGNTVGRIREVLHHSEYQGVALKLAVLDPATATVCIEDE
jgi:hypothetical protein